MSDKPEETPGQGAEGAPAKSKKMLVIIVAAVVLVAAAAGGWFYMSKKNAADLEDDEDEVTQTAAPAAPKGPPTYLPLDTMVVNLADPGGERVAQIGVVLELSDPKATDKVKPFIPGIRNSVLLLVSQRKAEELLTREGKEQLAADILAATETHFPSPAKEKGKKKKKDEGGESAGNPVRGVLFSSMIVQ